MNLAGQARSEFPWLRKITVMLVDKLCLKGIELGVFADIQEACVVAGRMLELWGNRL